MCNLYFCTEAYHKNWVKYFLYIQSTNMANPSQRVSTKERDFLEADPSIRGQNYVLLSFVSPEDLIAKRRNFMLHSYTQTIFNTLVNQLEHIKNGEVIPEYKNAKSAEFDFDNLTPEQVAKHNLDYLQIHYKDLASVQDFEGNYNGYLMNNEETLGKAFDKENQFATSVRGVKVRGVYDTLDEAQMQAQKIQARDPHFNVFLGSVGYWLPWDPSPHQVSNEEFYETELNTLMREYNKNRERAQNEWNTILSNMSGVPPAPEGTSTDQNEGNSLSTEPGDEVNVSEVENTLFDGDNVVTTSSENKN